MDLERDASTSHENIKRLYRSRVNKIIGGVCGGIADYFNVDPILIRIAWVLIIFFGGVGVIAYIVAMIIIPVNPDQSSATSKEISSSHDKAMLWGSVLILFGSILILKHLGLFNFFRLWDIPWQIIWAAFLIVFGIFLVYNRQSASHDDLPGENQAKAKQFFRVPKNKMVSGVCSGLSCYFEIDVTLIRLAWVVLTLASIGVGVLAYLIMVIVFPEQPE